MNKYELVTFILKLLPVLVIVVSGMLLAKEKKSVRIPVNVILGWISIVVVAYFYWGYAIGHAPTEEIKAKLIQKDGGAKTGSIFFGWIYSLALVSAFELIRWLLAVMNSKLKSNRVAGGF